MNLESMAGQVEEIRQSSIALRKITAMEQSEAEKEPLGGHIALREKEKKDLLTPSDEFLTSVFEECAAKLGFKYEYRDR